MTEYNPTLAYIVGVAMGDGNLSNSNGRAIRLRVSCDTKYPGIISEIQNAIQLVLPNNKVSIIKRKPTCIDISCYSNKWADLMPWVCGKGPKHIQGLQIPTWIKEKDDFLLACLRGLLQTDGCIYEDRGYLMVSFVTVIPALADDVKNAIEKFNFVVNTNIQKEGEKIPKYTLRISRRTQEFINLLALTKK